MVKAIITVRDKRARYDYTTRSKEFDTVTEAVNWALKCKNLLYKEVTLIGSNVKDGYEVFKL